MVNRTTVNGIRVAKVGPRRSPVCEQAAAVDVAVVDDVVAFYNARSLSMFPNRTDTHSYITHTIAHTRWRTHQQVFLTILAIAKRAIDVGLMSTSSSSTSQGGAKCPRRAMIAHARQYMSVCAASINNRLEYMCECECLIKMTRAHADHWVLLCVCG